MRNIAIACDKAAVDLKKEILAHIRGKEGFEAADIGPGDLEDYPVNAVRVAEAVADGTYDLGLLLCGTGAGMSMAANKVKGIRAAACSEPYTAQMARAHNNANILCLGARVVGAELAKMIVDAFLETGFDCANARHQKRVEMINGLE